MKYEKGNTIISTVAAKRGENPPGTRHSRRKRNVRNEMAHQSRKKNRHE